MNRRIRKQVFATMLFISVFLCSITFAAPLNAGSISPGIKNSIDEVQSLNIRAFKALQAGKYDLAEILFKDSLKMDPDNLDTIYSLSAVYVLQKRPESAVALLKRGLKKHPTDAGLFARLGDAYRETGKIKEAANNYQMALALNPAYPDAASHLAAAWVSMGNYTKAQELYLKALKLTPNDPELLSNLSAVYLANKKPGKALEAAERAVSLKPSPRAYLAMGAAREIMGELRNALLSYKKAAELGDQSPDLISRIKMLEKKLKL